VKGSKEVCMRRCDEEGMFVVCKAAVYESLKIVSQFGFMTVESEGTNLKAAANRGKVIRA
jgi:hypothetical protein